MRYPAGPLEKEFLKSYLTSPIAVKSPGTIFSDISAQVRLRLKTLDQFKAKNPKRNLSAHELLAKKELRFYQNYALLVKKWPILVVSESKSVEIRDTSVDIHEYLHEIIIALELYGKYIKKHPDTKNMFIQAISTSKEPFYTCVRKIIAK